MLQRLKEGNKKFLNSAQSLGDVSPAIRQKTSKEGQKPYAVIVTCSDSRVIPESIFSAGIGELFVVRTAGSTIDKASLGSIEYAVEHLGSKLVVVLGHTQCGAVTAAISHEEAHGCLGSIIAEISKAAGNETDLNKAIKLYQKAMSMDNLEAFNELGDLYMELDEFDSARNCYFDGARLGNVDCMANFGLMMTYAPECFEPAHYWLSKAIKHGNIVAMTLMGDLYKEYKNYPKALRWYRKAVSAGDDKATENLQLVKKLLKRHKPNYKLRLRESN